MTLKDCMLSRVVSGVRVGCDGRTCPTEECERCGWNKEEDARRRKLPLTVSEDGLYSRKPRLPGAPRHKPDPPERADTRGYRRKVIYTAPETGEEQVYRTTKEAAQAAGIAECTMNNWLRGKRRTPAAQCWRYADE